MVTYVVSTSVDLAPSANAAAALREWVGLAWLDLTWRCAAERASCRGSFDSEA
jgi:hypothetical protein